MRQKSARNYEKKLLFNSGDENEAWFQLNLVQCL